MATSLARQLAALRTPATQAITADTAYNGPFLFDEANQDNCDFAKLRDLARQALDKLTETEVIFSRYNRFLFDDRLDDQLESECIEEILFHLSPYLLMKPAQWVLQYMVIKHKVHYKYAEQFFFCALPFYEYDIYAKCLLAIDSIPGGTEYPNWLAKFRVSCAPTTKLALYRHTASDRGFLKLLTDMMLKLMKQTIEFPTMRIQRQTSMFVMTVLGGLENKDKISEEQALYILQVIFRGMKSNHAELIAMAQILLSYILPQMKFKEKVVTKMLKSVKNCIKKKASMESMMVVIMLVRTQNKINYEKKVWPIVASLEVVINEALNMLDDVETLHNVDNILYTLALLLQPLVADKRSPLPSCPQSALQLLAFSAQILKSFPATSRHLVSEETVAGIGDVAAKLVYRVRNTPTTSIVDADSVRNAAASADKILKQLNKSYPEIYQKVVVDTDDIDVYFMGDDASHASGKEGLVNKPASNAVAAKKILLNNNLVDVFKQKLIDPDLKKNPKAKKSLEKNGNDLKFLLEMETKFLLDNLPGDDFQYLMFNCLLMLGPVGQEIALRHLCSQEAWQDEKEASSSGDTMEIDVATPSTKDKEHSKGRRVDQFRLEMAVIPYFCQENNACRKTVVESFFGKRSDLISCLSSISCEHPDKKSAVIEKLKSQLTPAMVANFIKDECIWKNSAISHLFIKAMITKLSDGQFDINKQQLIKFIIEAIAVFGTKDGASGADDNTEQNKEEKKAAKSDKTLANDLINLLKILDVTSNVDEGLILLDSLHILAEAGKKKGVEAVEDILESKLKDELEILTFYLTCGTKSASIRTKFLVLARLVVVLENQNFVEKLLDSEHHIFPMLLSLCLNENQNVRKLGLSLIKKLKKQGSEDSGYHTIIKFLTANRSEIVSDLANLTGLLDKNKLESSDSSSSLQSLLLATTKCEPIVFETLVPFFTALKSKEAVTLVADFGLKILPSAAHDSTLACVIKKFYKKIIKFMNEAKCYEFFVGCIKCNRVINVAGLYLKISDLMLDRATIKKLWSTVINSNGGGEPSAVVRQLLEDAVKLSAESGNVKLISMLSVLDIPVHMFVDCLVQVWGADELKSKTRGGKSNFLGEDAGLDEKQLQIWGKSVFLLELLEACVPKELCDAGWQALVPPLFAVFRKLTNDDVMESSYKLNLVLTVLLKLLTIIPDNRIKELKQGDLEAELLTYCIRRSSNPESRQLALKVLARCSLTIPEYVLQNSMTIFTFMGTHLLKMDSKHSYQIACEAIDVIVPAMKSACTSKTDLQKISLDILNNFIHMEEDVPEHRYSEFVYRLIKALDAETYLWIAMLLCIKSTFKSKHRANRTNLIHRRLQDLMHRFSLQEALRGIIGILVNLRSDAAPLRKIFGCQQDRRENAEKADEWDVLRLGGLILLTKLVSSTDLATRVGTELVNQPEQIKDLLHLLLESSILTLEAFSALPETVPEKLKNSILEQGDKCLQLVLSLLPYKLYINIVSELLGASNVTLRRRAMEVVSSKLDPVEATGGGAGVDLAADAGKLLPALLQLAIKETLPENQQIAFLALRQIAKKVKDYGLLTNALATLNAKFLATLDHPGVLGAAILTITDILMAAGVQGVQYLDSLVKWLISAVQSLPQRKLEEKYCKVVYTSLLLSIQKITEKFGGFLNPYLDSIVMTACRLSTHPQAGARAQELWKSLAENLSPHVLLAKCKDLLEAAWKEPHTVAKLAGLVGLNSKKLERSQLTSMDAQLISFFSKALTYRQDKGGSTEAVETEVEVIEAFLLVGLKMCLDDFKPVFTKIVDKLRAGGVDPNLTTMFNFMERIAKSLKNLFGFGQEFVLTETITVLTSKECSDECAEAVLRCLSRVLVYNKISELPQNVYENLVSAILPLYQKSGDRLYQSVQDALLALADATENDVYWKHLNFCVLMELRNSEAEIRIQILKLVKRFVTSRRDTYMVVLPDAVPFLTEALEDDEQEVELECKDLIQHMETVFGQDIEAYFT